MVSGARPFLIALLMITLVSFFVILGVTMTLNSTNPSSQLLNNSANFNLATTANSLNQTITDFSSHAEAEREKLGGATPSPLYIFLIFGEALTIPIDFFKLIVSTIRTFTGSIFLSLGAVGLIISSVITAVLLITGIFLIIKAIRTGESER